MTSSVRIFPEGDYPHARVTGAVIAAANAVHRTLGYGFLEKVYKKALAIELRSMRFKVDVERRYHLSYRSEPTGYYDADLVVDDAVLVEAKTGLLPDPIAPVLTLNYLRASNLVVGLCIDFGPGLTVRRLVNRPSDRAGGEMTTL